MRKFSLTPIGISIGIACSSLLCPAQEAGEVTLQFVSFPKAIAPEPVELFLGDGKSIQVEIPTNMLSKPYRVPALKTWAVGKLEAGEENKMVFNAYGQAPALNSKSQLIVLVRKGKANAAGMEVIPIDNRFDKFGGGSFLFLNMTTIDIAGVCGEEKFVVKPNKRTLIQPKSKDGTKTFHTAFFFRKGEEAKPFFRSRWPVSERARSLIFFYHNPHNQRIQFHTIRNFVPE